MTPQAAKELLDVIMIDDFVGRRKALDIWTRRWVATMEASHSRRLDYLFESEGLYGKRWMAEAGRAVLIDKVLSGLMADEVRALEYGERRDASTSTITLRMHVVLQTPREEKEEEVPGEHQ